VLKDVVHEARGPLTISSIGSIPMPIPGLPMKGETYDVEDEDSGKLRREGLYAVGNAVTGKGNINVSYKHARVVAGRLLETYLVGDEAARAAELPEALGGEQAADMAAKIVERVKAAPKPTDEKRRELEKRVRELQARAGYEGPYTDYIAKVRPPPRKTT